MNKRSEIEIIRPQELAKQLGVHVTTLHRWRTTNPKFPKPVKIGNRAIAYRAADLQEWLQNRETEGGKV